MYPIDELNNDRAANYGHIYELIKSVNPSIQLYANPEGSGKKAITQQQLIELWPHVDIWQPRFPGSAESFKEHSEQLPSKSWWIYDNGNSPAKVNSPVCYRKMGLSAFEIGASGFGFWSFSDSGGSSAYDDFDVRRPDWSVVYEGGSDGFISSRRWEAFKTGIRDYKYLKSCQSEVHTGSNLACQEYYRIISPSHCERELNW